MRKTIYCMLTAGMMCFPAMGITFFVSPKGNDAHSGTRSQPFASFERAQQAVRSERAAHPEEQVEVVIKEGVYRLSSPIVFEHQDSGASMEKPVLYKAERGGEVVFSGGDRIEGWQKDDAYPGVWKTRLTDLKGDWRFQQLWVNDKRAVLARTPNYWEFYQLNGVKEIDATNGHAAHTFSVQPQDLSSLDGLSKSALSDVQLVAFHKWDTTRELLDSVVPNEGIFTTKGVKMQPWNGMDRQTLYYFENYFAALDAPGEWFLDKEGWLYYIPRPGENMKTANVMASRLNRFITISGTVTNSLQWVKNIRFEGLKFRYGDFRVTERGLPPGQAAMIVDAVAIQADGATNIQFQGCAVEHTGGTAFWFRKACMNCSVNESRLFDLGVSGVRIGEPGEVPETVRTRGITIDNCIIQSGGRIVQQAVGVWIGFSPDNAITHCDIGDFFYTAVSAGWRWGYEQSVCKRNRIEYNHLHHLGYRILSDMAAVYTLGPSEGTVVRNNVIHDVFCARYGGWGLYPDEGSSGILFENNLVYDVFDGSVHQHYGKENIFRNNVLAFSQQGQVAVTRAEPHLSFTFEHNIVYWNQGQLLGYGGWNAGAKVNLNSNLYWRVNGEKFDFAGKSLNQWQEAGRDVGSRIDDPLFMDADHRDFRLKPGSPAEKIGFKPIDYTQAGVYGTAKWKQQAQSLKCPKPYEMPEIPPLTINDHFDGPLSLLLNYASTDQEGRNDLITICQNTASSGTSSLRFLKVPGMKHGWNPHLYVDPNYKTGQGTMRFKIRLESGAGASCEWRDQGSPYHVGPSVQFHDNGLYVGGKKLLNMDSNVWVAIEIRTGLAQSGAQWSLRVTMPDGKSQEFKNLTCSPEWKTARWVGFSSSSTDNTSFYLDDFVLENK